MNLTANDKQVGGSHYAEGGNAQHWDWVSLNNIGYLEGAATKYIARWRKKDGKKDLLKAVHFIEKLIELHQLGFLPRRPRGLLARWVARPRRRLKLTVDEFARRNGLTVDERVACRLLEHWETRGDLERALAIVKNLHQNA